MDSMDNIDILWSNLCLSALVLSNFSMFFHPFVLEQGRGAQMLYGFLRSAKMVWYLLIYILTLLYLLIQLTMKLLLYSHCIEI